MAGKSILTIIILGLALLAGADETVLQQGLSAYTGCTDTYIQEFQASPYGGEEQLTAALEC